MTAKEFDLLAFLARHAGKVCTHQMILGQVWGGEYGSESEYLRVYIYRLRRKLGDAQGQMLRTAPGIGYSLIAAYRLSPHSGRRGVHDFFTPSSSFSTRRLQPRPHHGGMADFLVVLGIVAFALAMLGLIWALERV